VSSVITVIELGHKFWWSSAFSSSVLLSSTRARLGKLLTNINLTILELGIRARPWELDHNCPWARPQNSVTNLDYGAWYSRARPKLGWHCPIFSELWEIASIFLWIMGDNHGVTLPHFLLNYWRSPWSDTVPFSSKLWEVTMEQHCPIFFWVMGKHHGVTLPYFLLSYGRSPSRWTCPWSGLVLDRGSWRWALLWSWSCTR